MAMEWEETTNDPKGLKSKAMMVKHEHSTEADKPKGIESLKKSFKSLKVNFSLQWIKVLL